MATTQNTFNGNGSNLGPFSFTFKWLESTDIKVSVGGVLKTAGTHYNLQGLNYTTKTGGQVLFTAGNAPPVGTNNIRIYRDTDDEALSAVFSSGSAIRAKDLNDNFTQNLYVTQEINNNALNVDGSNPMVGPLNMNGFQIDNLAAPTSDTDAVNRAYVNDIVANGIGDGDKGDIVVSGSGSTFTIDSGAITNSKVNTTAGIVSSKLAFTQAGTGAVQRTVESKLQDVVSVKDFIPPGTNTETTDCTQYIQAAVNAVIAAGGGTVYIPNGTYLLNGVTGADNIIHGILIPFQSANNLTNRVNIIGQSKATRLLAGSNNMYIIRWSDSHGKLANLSLDGNGRTGVTALAVVPESTTQTTTLVFQQYNTFEDIIISGTAEGITLRTGPDVGGADSGCWYNKFNRIKIHQCTRGIWLRPCPVGSSPNNRNEFSNINIGQSTNTGIQIDDGDTNTFVQVTFEGIASGTTPNAVPTGIIIKQTATAGGDNNSNRFITCTMEAVTRAVNNSNSYTEFISCSLGGTFTSLFTAVPQVMLGGGDASTHPVITPAFTYQSNSQIAGVPNLALYPTNNIILKDNKDISDQSYPWQDYAITTSNTANAAVISEYRSKYKSIGQLVTWVCRFQFQATSTGGVNIELPVDPDSNLYRLFSNISPYEIPINVHNGSAVVAGRLIFSNHVSTLNGKAFITVVPFSGNFNTGGPYNTAWFTLTYHR